MNQKFRNAFAVTCVGVAGAIAIANTETVPDANVAPDNSAVNVRERSDAALTPEKQGSSNSDTETTRLIRQALTSNSDLSTYAANVKIITINGKVTLKGPVRSVKEKATVESIAKSVAGNTAVTNQLSVAK